MRIILLLNILMCFYACKDSKNDQTHTFSLKKGELIHIPDTLTVKDLAKDSIFSQIEANKFVFCNKFRILTPINGDCHACIEQLKQWKILINKWSTKELRFLFFINAENYAKFELINEYSGLRFTYPVIYDHNNEFMLTNGVPNDYIMNTMLIDCDGKLIAVGNPLKSKKAMRSYSKIICGDR